MTYLIYCCEVHRLWTVGWWRHCPFCFLAKCYLWNTCCITLNESDNDNWSVFWLRLLISYSINLVDCKTNGVLRKHSKNHDSHEISRKTPDSYMYMSCVRKRHKWHATLHVNIQCQIQYDMCQILYNMCLSCIWWSWTTYVTCASIYVFKRQEKPYIGIISDEIILCKRK